MIKFWITGRDGKLATDLRYFFNKKEVKYVATHREVDLLSLDAILRYLDEHRPSHIINTAAYMHIDESEGEGRKRSYTVNGEIPRLLALAAKEKGCHLIHISTDYVFDGTKQTPYHENDPCHPIQVYGKSKYLGESQMLEVYPKALSLRVACLYGSKSPNIITNFIQEMREKDAIEAIFDQRRTPTYNLDVARALLDLKNESGVLHFVNRGDVSRYELALEVMRLCGKYHVGIRAKEIRPISGRQAPFIALRPVRSILSTETVQKKLNWKIPSWEEALIRYFEECYDQW